VQKDWVSHLPTVELAINLATNESIGSSPFELVLGYRPRETYCRKTWTTVLFVRSLRPSVSG
jgi:hypothetical protein